MMMVVNILDQLLMVTILRRQPLLHPEIFRRELRKIGILVAGAEHVPGTPHPLDATDYGKNLGYEDNYYCHNIKNHTQSKLINNLREAASPSAGHTRLSQSSAASKSQERGR